MNQHSLSLEGLHTAIISPFTGNGDLDTDAFKRLIKKQTESGLQGVVICGTTGESPTVTEEEFITLLQIAGEESEGKLIITAGAGTNSTQTSIARAKIAQKHGADAVLVASPYYNKPTQKGLLAHFQAIAGATDLPLIVYNVPGRTAVNIETKTLVEMAAHPNIVAVKEASGNINQIMDVIEAVPDDFTVLAGDDAITLPTIAAGGRGGISVVSNEAPSLMNRMVRAALNGDYVEARRLHYSLYPLMKANFAESNPIVVKLALHEMGLIDNILRLPLVPASETLREPIREMLRELELL